MKKLLLFIVVAIGPVAGRAQSACWQQQADYKLEVTLDDSLHALNGHEQIRYYNNSPDTLRFIWIQIWANAFRNDRTAYSDALLEKRRTDFYFSEEDEKGYINRLSFSVNGVPAAIKNHPVHQDILQLLLPAPLPPHAYADIETPFHIRLPHNFSGNGYTGHAYQVTQWYPKPAVYDCMGWHEQPLLQNGHAYNEYGTVEATITLPQHYVVAASGDLQDEHEKEWLLAKDSNQVLARYPAMKTLHYRQEHTQDFVWMADPALLVQHRIIDIPGAKPVDAYVFYKKEQAARWKSTLDIIETAIRENSKRIGAYPYNSFSLATNSCPYTEAASYPGLSFLQTGATPQRMDFMIHHLVRSNWLQQALAGDPQTYPYLNSELEVYYDNRYLKQHRITVPQLSMLHPAWIQKRLPLYPAWIAPDSFTARAYYEKGIAMVQQPAGSVSYKKLSATAFDRMLQTYYRAYRFTHSAPEELQRIMDTVHQRQQDSLYVLIDSSQAFFLPVVDSMPALVPTATIKYGIDTVIQASKKKWRPAFLFNLRATDQYNYLSFAPAVGYNIYDRFMIGAAIHNYSIPLSRFRFFLAPMYATGSNEWNGTGRMDYLLYAGTHGQKLELSFAGASFSEYAFTDSAHHTIHFRYSKIVPGIRYTFPQRSPDIIRFIQWKTFFITEQTPVASFDTTNGTYTILSSPVSHSINQLQFGWRNNRTLYPYNAQLQIDQGKDFIRAGFTGHYFFNYTHHGGLNVRFFAGKFFYLGEKTFEKQAATDPYQLTLTGPRGSEDYTYSNYFLGRDAFDKLSAQQLMERDGFFKVGTELLSNRVGKTDDWMTALNFTADVPPAVNPLKVLPVKIPLKIFFDLGTYTDAWQGSSGTGKLLYDAGLQLSLLKNIINIYIPLLYSSVYRNYYASIFPQNKFWKSVSFSIDLQHIRPSSFIPKTILY